MPKVKVDEIVEQMSNEFASPCKFTQLGEYALANCPGGKTAEECKDCEGIDGSYAECWKNMFQLKADLKNNNQTLSDYIDAKNKKKTRGPRAKRNTVTTEELLNIDCWSNKLYNEAYDIVKDRLFPVVIPSYNRPECGFLKWVTKIVQPGYEYPIFMVVRQSQKELYEASEYVKYNDYIHIKALPDEMIDDIGKVREQIVNVFSKKYDCLFMFDDDITNFCHSVPYFRTNGEPKAQGVKSNNFGKTMAMWQVAMEYAVKQYDVAFSTGMMQGFSWVPDFIKVEQSIRLMSGLPTLAVCVNVKKLKEVGLNYRTLIGNGHDDIDLYIRSLQKGLVSAEFRWMTYSSPGIGTDILHFNSVHERFATQQKEMYANFSDVPFVKFYTPRGLPNVGIKWNVVLDYYKEHGFGDFKENRFSDLWRDGKLLEEAKNRFEG